MSTSSFFLAPGSDHLDRVHQPHEPYLDPRVRRVIGWMWRNLQLRLSLSKLAGAIALSPSRFSHLFKAETGVSPAQYLKSIRLRQARDLLESTNLSVKEVAGCVGLGVSRLIKEYRSRYGATPAQHRRLMYQPVGEGTGPGLRPEPARDLAEWP